MLLGSFQPLPLARLKWSYLINSLCNIFKSSRQRMHVFLSPYLFPFHLSKAAICTPGEGNGQICGGVFVRRWWLLTRIPLDECGHSQLAVRSLALIWHPLLSCSHLCLWPPHSGLGQKRWFSLSYPVHSRFLAEKQCSPKFPSPGQ